MEKIIFEYNDDTNQYALESAWAEKIGDNYKLNNILFYAPNYAWGDIVKVEDRSGELYVIGLVEESGHSTIRIIFFNIEIIKPTMEQLEKMGCNWEGSDSPALISIDVPAEINYSNIKKFLDNGEEHDMWSYQEACLAHK